MASQDRGSSLPQCGGEVARAKPEKEREATEPPSRRSPVKFARARALRRGGNIAEALLWNELKAKRPGGYKCVRQMPLEHISLISPAEVKGWLSNWMEASTRKVRMIGGVMNSCKTMVFL